MRKLYIILPFLLLYHFANGQNCLNGNIIVEDALCNGETNGLIDYQPTNGTAPYFYELDGGPITPLTGPIDGLPAGCYTLIVTDNVGCSGTETICVNEPPQLSASAIAFDQTCFLFCDGGGEVIVTGGVAPYAFVWSTGGTASLEFGLCAGVYDITITDANGCTVVVTLFVTEPPPMWMDVQVLQGTCIGSNSGSAIATVTGGATPYFFQWDNGETGATATGLSPGIHLVTVFDANQCWIEDTIDIPALPLLEFALQTSDETCLGQDGSATVQGTSGNPPYQYVWSTGENTQTITGLSAGTYFVEIIDSEGCIGDTTFVIAGAISIDVATTFTTCNTNDGTATATVLDGSDNPTFSWSNGQTGPVATGLAPGGYSVTVVDQLTQCSSHVNAYVEEDPACVVVISGFVYMDDVNPDCVNDTTTIPRPNRLVDIEPGGATFTDANGYYEFIMEEGTYQLSVDPWQFEEVLCPATNLITVLAPTPGTSHPGNDFYLGLEDVNDLCVSYCSGPARPGFDWWNYIFYCNYGSLSQDGTVTLVHDSLVTWVSSFPPPDSYDPVTYTATYSFSNLAAGQCSQIQYNLNIPVGTPLGTLLQSSVHIDPVAGDINPGNNSKDWNTLVTGAYDPNDKQNFTGINPFGGDIKPTDSLFQYLIRFQNTGTDTAFTVILKDTLDLKLDVNSLRPIGSSHPYSMTMEDENVLVVTYENIMLPDSNINEPESHGFFRFDIEWKEQPDFGTQFFNQAAIFFDFNPPVLTNIVENVVEIPVSVEVVSEDSNEFYVWPNPTDDHVELLIEGDSNVEEISIYSMKGDLFYKRKIPVDSHQENRFMLNVKDFPAGIYLISVRTSESMFTRRLVKR